MKQRYEIVESQGGFDICDNYATDDRNPEDTVTRKMVTIFDSYGTDYSRRKLAEAFVLILNGFISTGEESNEE